MDFIRGLLGIVAAAIAILAALAFIGWLGLAVDNKTESQKAAHSQAQDGYTKNRWLYITCRPGGPSEPNDGRVINCNHRALVGALAAGYEREPGPTTAAWYNICVFNDAKISIVGFDGRCHDLVVAPAGKTPDQLSLVGRRFYIKEHKAIYLPTAVRTDSIWWDASTDTIQINEGEVAEDSSGFGRYGIATYTFLAAVGWKSFALISLVFAYLAYMAYVGAGIRGKRYFDDNIYAAVVFFSLLFFAFSLGLYSDYGTKIKEYNHQFTSHVAAANHHLSTLEVPGVGYKPYAYDWYPRGGLTPSQDIRVNGSFGRQLFGGLTAVAWHLVFLPFLVFCFVTQIFNVFAGSIHMFSKARHQEGYQGVRSAVEKEAKSFSVSDSTTSIIDTIAAPFRCWFSRSMAVKNEAKASAMSAMAKEVDTDIEVAQEEVNLNIKRKHLAELEKEIQAQEKALGKKRRG